MSTIKPVQTSTFGKRLREERERMRATQDVFAELGGVQRRAQANYETDERAPDTEYLTGLMRAGVDVFYLLSGERKNERVGVRSIQEQALLNCYRSASAPGQYAILNCALALNKHFFDEHNSEAITEAAKSEAQLLIQEGKDSVQLAGMVSTKHFGK